MNSALQKFQRVWCGAALLAVLCLMQTCDVAAKELFVARAEWMQQGLTRWWVTSANELVRE